MTFLGYDPVALTALADWLRRASDELSVLASAPGVGDQPQHRRPLMEVIDTVSLWAHRVHAIAVCDVMERQHPVMLDATAPLLTPVERAVVQRWESDGLAVVQMPDAPDLPASALVATLPPDLAAAAMVTLAAEGELGGLALGTAAVDVLERWAKGPWWATAGDTPLNVADHVLAAVVGDTEALATLWEHRQSTLGIVLYGPNDAARVRAVLQGWTHPSVVDGSTAADRVLPLVHYVRTVPHATAPELTGLRDDLVLNPGFGESHESRWWTVREAMADVVAPWQVWMTTGHQRWGGSSGDAVDTMHWVLESPGTESVFAQWLGPALSSRAEQLGDDPLQRRATIERLAWSIGVVDALVEQADQARQRSGDAGLDLLRGLVALSVGHAAGAAAAAATAVVAPPLAGVARTVSSGRITQALDDDHGWERRRERARLASLDRRSVAATGLMALVVADHRRRGWLSLDVPAPPPPASRSADDPGAPDPLAEWLAFVDTLDDDQVHEVARRELHQVWNAVTPAAERAAVDRGRLEVSR